MTTDPGTVIELAFPRTGGPVPGILGLTSLSEQETALVQAMSGRLSLVAEHNHRKASAYDAKRSARHLGISIPPAFRKVETVLGWPGTAVDVLEEHINLEDIVLPGSTDEGLADLIADNNLLLEAQQAHLDALIYGTSFIAVGTGQGDEPEVLVTVESPEHMTAIWDRRSRRVQAAASFTSVEGREAEVTLYLTDQTVRAVRTGDGWVVVDRDQHNLGRVPVVQLVNRRRPSDVTGRSEITRAVLAYTDAGVRTLLGMDVAREFYAAPQRYILGADESAFQDAQGNSRDAWSTYLGRILALTRDENGELPQVGQFTASSPSPYLEQLRGLAQLFSAEAGLPVSYLGIVTDNPASADAIREAKARLISRASRRQSAWSPTGWAEVARLGLLIRDGALPDNANRIQVLWGDPASPTPSAQADQASKLVGSGIIPATADVTREMSGLTQQQRQRLAVEERRTAGRTATTELAAAAQSALADPAVAALTGRRPASATAQTDPA